jgi:hypothetical protein
MSVEKVLEVLSRHVEKGGQQFRMNYHRDTFPFATRVLQNRGDIRDHWNDGPTIFYELQSEYQELLARGHTWLGTLVSRIIGPCGWQNRGGGKPRLPEDGTNDTYIRTQASLTFETQEKR